MKLKNGKYDVSKTCGNQMLLTGIAARYNYADGKRVGEPIGYTYTVVVPVRMFDQLHVYIPGACNIEAPTEPTPVKFENLELVVKWSKSEGDHIAGEAAGIALIK